MQHDPIAILIDTCLTYIRTHFYADKARRDYHRDEQSLTKAIARYGYACAQRHWLFEPLEIQQDIIALLRKTVDRADQIQYLPIYLEKAIDRHIGERAEELSAKAKAKKEVPALVQKKLHGTQVVVIEQIPAVQVLCTVYEDLRQRQQQARAKRKAITHAKTKEQQEPTLL